mgnify:CR=1 FL=1
MSESEQPTPQEVKYENPVVGVVRSATRAALETNEKVNEWRDSLTVQDKSVYRAWIEATNNYVNTMTETDRNKLSTKLYQLKNYVGAAVVGVSSWTIDNTVNLASKGLKVAGIAAVGAIALPAIPFSFGLVGAGLGLYAAGAVGESFHKGKTRGRAIDRLKTMRFLKALPFGESIAKLMPIDKLLPKKAAPFGVTKRIGIHMAEQHEKSKIEAYKAKLTIEQRKNFEGFVKQTAKNIVTGFAYPEGRPPKSVMK